MPTLLSIPIPQVDRLWERFRSEYGGVCQLVELTFSELTVQLHQAALCSLMAFADSLSRQLGSLAPQDEGQTQPPARTGSAAVTAAEGTAEVAAEKRAG